MAKLPPPQRISYQGIEIVFEVKANKHMRLMISRRDGLPHLIATPRTTETAAMTFLRDNLPWLRKTMERIHTAPGIPTPSAEQIQAFHASLPAIFHRWEEEMNLHASKIKTRAMRSRWGSCNPTTRSITINTLLASYPRQCLDYVIVHELAHIIHPNHSPQFWEIVATYHPQHKATRQLLRTHGRKRTPQPYLPTKTTS